MSIKARRAAVRVSVGTSALILLALLIFAPLRHHAWHSGWTIAVSASISVVSGLLYLHSTRGGAR